MFTAVDEFGGLVAVRSKGAAGIEIVPGLELPCLKARFGRNEEIHAEAEPADLVCKVLQGVVRTVKVLSDGRRQVAAFYLPGDVLGLEEAAGAPHRFAAEAIGEVEVALVRRSLLDRAAAGDARVARQLWALAASELERAQDHLLLLGRMSAIERVAAFLVRMAARAPAFAGAVDLSMSRADIADHLGLTIETVSRCLGQLQRERAIALPGSRRHIELRRAALQQHLDA